MEMILPSVGRPRLVLSTSMYLQAGMGMGGQWLLVMSKETRCGGGSNSSSSGGASTTSVSFSEYKQV